MSPAPVAPDRFARRRWGVRLQRWRWPLVTAVLLALGAAAAEVLLGSRLLAVHRVEVTGVGSSRVAQVSPTEVRDVVGPDVGLPLARVNLDEMASRVEELPGVASATASRSWPRAVRIDVVERVPVALVDVDGTWRAMDTVGAVFGRYKQPPTGMPEVLVDDVDPGQLRSALAEVGAVIDALDPFVSARVDSVQVASRDDIVLVLTSGERVRWGNAEDSTRKADVLTVLLRIPAAVYDVTVPELPTTSQTAVDTPTGSPSTS